MRSMLVERGLKRRVDLVEIPQQAAVSTAAEAAAHELAHDPGAFRVGVYRRGRDPQAFGESGLQERCSVA